MVTSAIDSWNTILARTGNDIAEVQSIKGPTMTLNAVDVTHLTSPNQFKEFIGGLRDGGEISIEGNFYPGDTLGQIGLRNDLLNATVQDFTITFPVASGTVVTFKGLVVSFELGAVVDDRLTFSAGIKVTAKPDIGVTASANITAFVITEITGPAVVTGVPTPFAAGTYEYSYVVDTASGSVTINVTQATAVLITVYNDVNGITSTLLTTVESGALALGVADTISQLIVTVKDAAKAPTVYTFHIVRP